MSQERLKSSTASNLPQYSYHLTGHSKIAGLCRNLDWSEGRIRRLQANPLARLDESLDRLFVVQHRQGNFPAFDLSLFSDNRMVTVMDVAVPHTVASDPRNKKLPSSKHLAQEHKYSVLFVGMNGNAGRDLSGKRHAMQTPEQAD